MIKKALSTATLLAAGLWLTSCGKETTETTRTTAPPTTETGAPAPAKPAGKMTVDNATAAKLTGTVTFQGTAPEQPAIKMSADQFCLTAHAEPPAAHNVVVNSNGTLKNVFVYVKSGLDNYDFPVPSDPVVLGQEGCLFKPRVFGVMANQEISVHNGDSTLHNVHALPQKNKEFNLAMPIKDMKIPQKFSIPEVMIKFKCDVHPWMNAYAGVLSHPVYSVTEDSGEFTLEGLPPGTYTIEAWHETYGTKTQEVTVGPSESKAIEFSFASTDTA